MDTTQRDRWCRNCGAYVVTDEAGGWMHLATGNRMCTRPIRGVGKSAEPYERQPITYKKETHDEAGIPRHRNDGPAD